MSWWRSYFDQSFLLLHEDLFPERESRREVASLIEMMGLPQGARLLDAPCGWGRHTRLFAEAGYETHGADLSLTLLARAAGNGVDRLVAADVRALPYRPASFAAVLNLFTSLGLFLDDAEDLAVLREARRVLRADGVFVLESMHRDDVIAEYAERDAWVLPNGAEVEVRRRFDPVTGISEERLRWRHGALRGHKRHSLRLRTATEIDALLRAAGFGEIRYYGDWGGQRLRRRSPRLIAVARPAPHY
jgi:ubiquinone/menaquinone biosynthesis C-methylase UbiE